MTCGAQSPADTTRTKQMTRAAEMNDLHWGKLGMNLMPNKSKVIAQIL